MIVNRPAPRANVTIGAGLALLLCATFLILTINRLHMHADEELSYRATNGTLIEVLRWQIDLEDNQAPLWFLTFRIWRTLVGDSEFTARVMGMLLTLIALAFTVRIAWESGSRAAGWLPALLVGGGLFAQYALDIRMYPLVSLTAALSTWALARWGRTGKPRHGWVYGLTVALMLYTHYLLIFLVAAQALYLLIARRIDRRLIGGALLAAVGVAPWLVWMPVAITQVRHLQRIEAASGTARGAAGIGVSTFATKPESIATFVSFATNEGLLPFYALIWLGGALLLTRRRTRSSAALALLWALGVPAIVFTANLAAGVYAPRFIAYTTLGGALLLTLLLTHLSTGARLLVAGVWIAAHLLTFPSTLPADRIPYRDLLSQVNAASRPGDTVLLIRAGEGDGFVRWQLNRYLTPALSASVTTDPDVARAAGGRIWLITGDWFHDDVRALFAVLEPIYPVRLVIGDCTRAWCYLAQRMGD